MTRTIGGETGNGVGLRTRCGARHGDGRAGTGTNRGGKGAGSGRIGKGKLPRDVVRIRRTATQAPGVAVTESEQTGFCVSGLVTATVTIVPSVMV